jgi:hemerythrin
MKKSIYNADKNIESNIVLKFLRGWWMGHINKEDRKYVPFLNKQ